MKQIQITDSVLIWQAQEYAENIQLVRGIINYNMIGHTFVHHHRLQDATYTHLTPIPELSEDECKGMVEKCRTGYRNYHNDYTNIHNWTYAKPSLESRLVKAGFTPSNCYAVFKR